MQRVTLENVERDKRFDDYILGRITDLRQGHRRTGLLRIPPSGLGWFDYGPAVKLERRGVAARFREYGAVKIQRREYWGPPELSREPPPGFD